MSKNGPKITTTVSSPISIRVQIGDLSYHLSGACGRLVCSCEDIKQKINKPGDFVTDLMNSFSKSEYNLSTNMLTLVIIQRQQYDMMKILTIRDNYFT